MIVGLFSSYAEKIKQGWEALQDASRVTRSSNSPENPRSLPRITPERLEAMIADYESGMSAYDLADKYGQHRTTIMKHLAAAGIRSRVAVPTDEEVLLWRELHAEGLGFKTIARRVERNHKTVRKYLR